MHIPPKCRLAVVAMMDLALHQGQGPVPLSAISARQQVSPSYLDLLFGRLRRNGLVTGMRGPGGGYLLARETKEISLADIVSAADDDGASAEPGHRSFSDRPRSGHRIGSEWCIALEQTMLQQLAEVSLDTALGPNRDRTAAKPGKPARLSTAKGVGPRERMIVIAANSVFARPMRLAI